MSVRQTRYRSWKSVALRGSSHPVIRLRNCSRISVAAAIVSETSGADFEPRTIASFSMGANQKHTPGSVSELSNRQQGVVESGGRSNTTP